MKTEKQKEILVRTECNRILTKGRKKENREW